MKKRTTVMATLFSFVWMFPNFLLLSPNSGSFLSELFSEPFSELSLLPYGWDLLQRTSNCSRSFQKIFPIHIIYNNTHEYCHGFIKRLVF